jgi:hypothetical protein
MPQQRKSKTIAHPVSVVIFVPVEVEVDDAWNGVEWTETSRGLPVPCVVDITKAGDAMTVLGPAALATEGVAAALDALILAARDVQDRYLGVEVNATAWFRVTEFQEVS